MTTKVAHNQLSGTPSITTAAAIASTNISVGEVVNLSDRGYSEWDAVLASGVTPNGMK